MEELKRLIEQERQVFEQREHFYSQADTKYKCVHRLHWAKHQQPTLHQLYDLEKKIEDRAEFLFQKYKDNPEYIEQVIKIFQDRLKQVINYIEKEKKHWEKIHQNIQKELTDNIEEYKNQFNFLEIRRLSLERKLSKTY